MPGVPRTTGLIGLLCGLLLALPGSVAASSAAPHQQHQQANDETGQAVRELLDEYLARKLLEDLPEERTRELQSRFRGRLDGLASTNSDAFSSLFGNRFRPPVAEEPEEEDEEEAPEEDPFVEDKPTQGGSEPGISPEFLFDDEIGPINGFVDLARELADEAIRSAAAPSDLLCASVSGERPEIVCSDDREENIRSILRLVAFSACNEVSESLNPLKDAILELVDECLGLDRFESMQEPGENRRIEACVSKFDDGSYDGLVPNPPDLPANALTGFPNKYGWTTNFNGDVGIGVVIHSAGGLAVNAGRYSLPTITLRDRTGGIIYEGVYADSVETNFEAVPVQGLRSGVVTQRVGSVVTVVSASVSLPVGEFFVFDLDLDDYDGSTPVEGLVPLTRTPGFSASVRAQQLIAPDVILYAPLFDVGSNTEGRGGNPGFPLLRLFNWRTATELGVEIVFDDTGFPFESSFVWDFECSEDEGGVCFVNILDIIDPLKGVFEGNEETIGRIFTFPLSVLTGQLPTEAGVVSRIGVPSTTVNTDFDVAFSVNSIEILSPTSAVICTLSGFLFAIAQNLSNNGGVAGSSFFDENGDRVPLPDVLARFELGNVQQCNVCEGSSCRKVGINDQRSSNVYIWAIEECGGKVFAGTNDLSFFFGTLLVGSLTNRLSAAACGSPSVRRVACLTNRCPGDEESDAAICQDAVRAFLVNTFEVLDLERPLTAFLATLLYSEKITQADFGFDLYSIDKDDLATGNPTFQPITLDGFSELATDDAIDDGVRNMICLEADPAEGVPASTLVVASAVFGGGRDQSSNTYLLDLGFGCQRILQL